MKPQTTKHRRWKSFLFFALTSAFLIAGTAFWIRGQRGIAEEPQGGSRLDEINRELVEKQGALLESLSTVLDESRGLGPEEAIATVHAWKVDNSDELDAIQRLGAERDALDPVVDGSADDGQRGLANNAGASSLAVGFNNRVAGEQSAALGEGLVVRPANATAVGSFNATSGESGDAVFAVGIGTAEERANAFEVHANGDVVINKPQGDIPMGKFRK